MRFIHTGDWHIGKSTAPQRYGAEFAKARKQELLKTAENMVRFANENQVDLILCAGDLFHSEDAHLEELKNLNVILSKLDGPRMVVTPGNHDPLLPGGAYNRLSWCQQVIICPPGVGKISFPELNTTVHTYGWQEKEQAQPILENWHPKKESQIDILLIHGDAINVQSKYLPLSPSWLRSLPMDYVALGHIHQAAVLEDHIRYCGSPEPQDISETGEHGFWLCDVAEGRRTVKKVACAQRSCYKAQLELNGQSAPWQLRTAIRQMAEEKGLQNLYDIQLTGHYGLGENIDCDQLRQELLADGILCRLRDRSAPDYDLDRLMEENKNSLLGNYIQLFHGKTLTPVEQKALDLGVEALLEEMRNQ